MIGITLITFLVMKLAPGDPDMLKLMFSAKGLDPQAVAALLKEKRPAIELPEWYQKFSTNLSQSVHDEDDVTKQQTFKSMKWLGENSVFYAKWLKNLAMFNFGLSSKDHRPVLTKVAEALPYTLIINFLTIGIIYFVSVPLGIWSALRKGKLIDKIVMIKLFVLYSLPTFWVASLLLMYFAGGEYFNFFPLVGIKSDYYDQLSVVGKFFDMSWHLILPVVASTIGSFAFLARFSRSGFLDVIGQDYVRTARAKGLSENTVLYKHALRNALIPFVTLMGGLLPGLLGGSVIIEQIFNIPGMGMLSFESVLNRDQNVIMGVATIGALLTLVGILISDLLYVAVDPRVRLE